MANDTVKLEKFGAGLSDILSELTEETEDAYKRAVRKAAIRVFSNIIKMTPVDTGRARANWFVDTQLHSSVRMRDDAIGEDYVARSVPRAMDSAVYLFNNLPYIETLEYGGYPNPPQEGSRQKDGTYKIKSENGYSKQAPAGMVRVSLAEWGDILKKQIDIEMAKL